MINDQIHLLSGLRALEIGGPSESYKNLNVYSVITGCDGLNFASDPSITQGVPMGDYNYSAGKTGTFYFGEATDMNFFPDSTYDLILASDVLEHISDPLKALKEWRRVVKPGGYLFLVLPRKESNFDHQRPTTTFEHLLDDHARMVDEHDMTHLEEIIKLHDLERDPWAKPFTWFVQRSIDNIKHRNLHHHVFDAELLRKCCEATHLDVVEISEIFTNYFMFAQVNKNA